MLECLTNMAVLPDWHHLLPPLLPRLLATAVGTPHPALRLQALRLLINLSCSEEMVGPLLGTSCEDGLASILQPSNPEEQLLRKFKAPHTGYLKVYQAVF